MRLRASIVILALTALAGCGGSDSTPGPGGTQLIATVDGVEDGGVTRADFDRRLKLLLADDQARRATAPDPPHYEKCVAETRKQIAQIAPPPGVKLPKPTAADMLKSCKQAYQDIRDNAVSALTTAIWIREEVAARGIEVTPEMVEAQLAKEIPVMGMSEEEVEAEARIHAAAIALGELIAADQRPPTAAEVAAYQAEHASEFVRPERRELLLVSTRSMAEAEEAFARLRAGEDFAAVAAELSVDPLSKDAGGRSTYQEGQAGDPALDGAISTAPKGRLMGPVKGANGQILVFEVTKIVPGGTLTPAEAAKAARERLVAERRQKLLQGFMDRLRDKWRPRTTCEREYLGPDCRGYKAAAR